MLGLFCQTIIFGMEEKVALKRCNESPKTMEELTKNELFRLACAIKKSESCIAGNEHWMLWWVHTKQYGNGRSGPCAKLFVNDHDKIVVVCFEGTGSKEEVDLQASDPKKFGNVKAHDGIAGLTYEVTSPFFGNMEEEKRKHFQNGALPNKKLDSWIRYYEKYQYNFLVMGHSVGGAQALLYYMKLVECSITANDSGHICVAFAPSGCVTQKSVNVYNNQFTHAYTVFNPNDPVSYFGHYYEPEKRYHAPGIPIILGTLGRLEMSARSDFSILWKSIREKRFQ